MRAAFFDLDKTVIAKASIAAFGRPLYRGGLINRRPRGPGPGLPAHLPAPRGQRAEAGPGPRVDAHADQGLGPGPDRRDRAGGARGDRRADHLRRGPRPHRGPPGRRPPGLPGLGLTRGDRRSRWPSTWASTGPSPAGPSSTTTAATPARWSSTPTGPFKAEAIAELAERDGIDLAESSAYSDSYTDLPMLEAVGHPVAVNPDRVLAKLARSGSGRSCSSPSRSGCATGSACPACR